MPKLMCLMLSVAGKEQSQSVYDIVLTTKDKSMTDAVCAGLAGLPRGGVDPLLLLTMQQWLERSDARESVDVDLPALGLRLQNAQAQATGDDAFLLQAGTVGFVVEGTCLSTQTQGLHALCSSKHHTLTLLALINTKARHTDPGSRTSFHFVREQDGEFVDLRALQLGKRSAGVILPMNASHFQRRSQQLRAHAAAMQNVGVSVCAMSTRRTHTPLLDVYVSRPQQQQKQLECVSIFV
jgi:hypothetical protein